MCCLFREWNDADRCTFGLHVWRGKSRLYLSVHERRIELDEGERSEQFLELRSRISKWQQPDGGGQLAVEFKPPACSLHFHEFGTELDRGKRSHERLAVCRLLSERKTYGGGSSDRGHLLFNRCRGTLGFQQFNALLDKHGVFSERPEDGGCVIWGSRRLQWQRQDLYISRWRRNMD